MTITYDEYEKELSKMTIVQLKSELIRQEIQLAGFNPRHLIRPSLELQIKQVKAKIGSGADVVDWGIRSIQSLESELKALNTTLEGFGAGSRHYIVPEIQADIKAVEEQLIQKKTWN